jgi:hypothetical protein
MNGFDEEGFEFLLHLIIIHWKDKPFSHLRLEVDSLRKKYTNQSDEAKLIVAKRLHAELLQFAVLNEQPIEAVRDMYQQCMQSGFRTPSNYASTVLCYAYYSKECGDSASGILALHTAYDKLSQITEQEMSAKGRADMLGFIERAIKRLS